MIDVNALIGPYPFRHVPHPDPDVLVRVLDREGIDGAWVGHLPSAFHRDPSAGQRALYAALAPLRRPASARARDSSRLARGGQARSRARRAAAPGDARVSAAMGTCAGRTSVGSCATSPSPPARSGIAVLLTVRFEDLRQRHPMDSPATGTAATVRALARAGEAVRLVVTAAGARDDRGSALGPHAGRAAARLLGHLVDLGPARGPSGEALSHDRREAIRLRHAVAVAV